MEAMHLEKDPYNRSPAKDSTIFSPVFKISSRNPITANGRSPSPTSPSPQRRKILSNDTGNSTTITPSKVVSPTSKTPLHSGSLQKQSIFNDGPKTDLPPDPLASSSTIKVQASFRAPSKTPSKMLPTQRIPSSATPSPLTTKLMGRPPSDVNKISESSFEGFSLQSASVKALSRNLGALLGSKRAAEDDPDGGTSSATSGTEGPRKRPRRPQPNRTKVCFSDLSYSRPNSL